MEVAKPNLSAAPLGAEFLIRFGVLLAALVVLALYGAFTRGNWSATVR